MAVPGKTEATTSQTTNAATSPAAVAAAAARYEAQQEVYREFRKHLVSLVQGSPKDVAEAGLIFYTELMGRVQEMAWSEIYGLVKVMSVLNPVNQECVFTLLGWFPPPLIDCTKKPTRPDEALIKKLIRYRDYQDYPKLLKTVCPNGEFNRTEYDKLCLWLEARAECFGGARNTQGVGGLMRAEELAQKNSKPLLLSIRNHFLDLDNPVMCFYPTTGDSLEGWRDFYEFARAYNTLPERVKNDFGGYDLLIEPLPPPAAKK
jgi:hypothetical protein